MASQISNKIHERKNKSIKPDIALVSFDCEPI